MEAQVTRGSLCLLSNNCWIRKTCRQQLPSAMPSQHRGPPGVLWWLVAVMVHGWRQSRLHSSITTQNTKNNNNNDRRRRKKKAFLGYGGTLHCDITYRSTDLTNPSVWAFECALESFPRRIAVRWEDQKNKNKKTKKGYLPKEKDRDGAKAAPRCVL